MTNSRVKLDRREQLGTKHKLMGVVEVKLLDGSEKRGGDADVG